MIQVFQCNPVLASHHCRLEKPFLFPKAQLRSTLESVPWPSSQRITLTHQHPPTSSDIQYVYREWYDETAVRATLVDHGVLIVSHKGPPEIVKMTSKDCVRNMYVLMPLLQRRLILASTSLRSKLQGQSYFVRYIQNCFPFLPYTFR